MSWRQRITIAAAIVCGLFVAALTGSRAGWVALLFTVPTVLALHIGWGARYRRLAGAAFAVLLALATVFWLDPALTQKMSLGVSRLLAYDFDAPDQTSSIGIRISLWRLAFELIGERPLLGWGVRGWLLGYHDGRLPAYVGEQVMFFAGAGFHSELLTKLVHHGLAAGLASAALIIMPVPAFLRRRGGRVEDRPIMVAAVVYFVSLAVASFATETFDLKYQYSLYGTLLAVFGVPLLLNDEHPHHDA
ncbi:MAG: O-antigen ligase family protein [Burkholderiaceae bacterium]